MSLNLAIADGNDEKNCWSQVLSLPRHRVSASAEVAVVFLTLLGDWESVNSPRTRFIFHEREKWTTKESSCTDGLFTPRLSEAVLPTLNDRLTAFTRKKPRQQWEATTQFLDHDSIISRCECKLCRFTSWSLPSTSGIYHTATQWAWGKNVYWNSVEVSPAYVYSNSVV